MLLSCEIQARYGFGHGVFREAANNPHGNLRLDESAQWGR